MVKKTVKNQEQNTNKNTSPSTRKTSKNRRSADPLNALEKKYTLKSRADEVDYDYLDKLSYEEKLWLAKFTAEEIHCSVKKYGHKEKNKFNKSKKDIKAKFDRNNARNRCIWTQEKAKGMAQYLEDHKETLLSQNPENYLVVKMDLETQGWVDNDGEVVITEEELQKKLYMEQKKVPKKKEEKELSSKKKSLPKKRNGLNNCSKPNCKFCNLLKKTKAL